MRSVAAFRMTCSPRRSEVTDFPPGHFRLCGKIKIPKMSLSPSRVRFQRSLPPVGNGTFASISRFRLHRDTHSVIRGQYIICVRSRALQHEYLTHAQLRCVAVTVDWGALALPCVNSLRQVHPVRIDECSQYFDETDMRFLFARENCRVSRRREGRIS